MGSLRSHVEWKLLLPVEVGMMSTQQNIVCVSSLPLNYMAQSSTAVSVAVCRRTFVSFADISITKMSNFIGVLKLSRLLISLSRTLRYDTLMPHEAAIVLRFG